jgi:hypothetical protein
MLLLAVTVRHHKSRLSLLLPLLLFAGSHALHMAGQGCWEVSCLDWRSGFSQAARAF